MNAKNLKICKGLVKINGKDFVLDKLHEECLELALAITQLKCHTKNNKQKRLEDVLKEVADVKYNLRMVEMVLPKKKINKYVNIKLEKKKIKYLK